MAHRTEVLEMPNGTFAVACTCTWNAQNFPRFKDAKVAGNGHKMSELHPSLPIGTPPKK